MLDFMMISARNTKECVEIYPLFIVGSSTDLMTRGSDFYAIWNEDENLWSTKEDTAIKIIDKQVTQFSNQAVMYAEQIRSHAISIGELNSDYRKVVDTILKREDLSQVRVLNLWNSETGMIDKFHRYVQKHLRDSYHPLDEKLIFSNVQTTKEDYASKKLPYPLENCETPAFNELIDKLYSPEERHKLEWAIGAVVSGDSKKIQKFIVMYGAAGTGKSTMLNIIQDLFEGYYSVFDSKALGSSNNSFALEAFKSNPLVAIQHDGDLSHIEDNTRLNSLVSHEIMTVNEKFKSAYSNKFNCFLFMGTNKPVRITDSRSGIIRRLIDVKPSGEKLSPERYKTLMRQIKFELGGIASHCLEVYQEDPGYYDNYIPTEMIGATNDFYNFVLNSYSIFAREKNTTLKAAWEMYNTYNEKARVRTPLPYRAFGEELKSYFKDYETRYTFPDGTKVRSYYIDFIEDKFENEEKDISEEAGDVKVEEHQWLQFQNSVSLFDRDFEDCPAQYASNDERPMWKWDNVKTKLSDISTDMLHYVKVPQNLIVIDFDIPNMNGEKSFEENYREAVLWPQTYAELSKSGQGIHLHYYYSGDVNKLSRIFDDHVEIKVFNGGSSLRRKLTKCNDIPIATITSGLPLREENKVIDFEGFKNEKALVTFIKRNLNKEYSPHATKPSIDYICSAIEKSYASGIEYDVTPLYNSMMYFAGSSTHNSDYCIKKLLSIEDKLKSRETSDNLESYNSDTIVFFDVEVFPNLFVVVYKPQGGKCVKMINPTPTDITRLVQFKLVGFNNRKYDNHILYARMLGYSNRQLFDLSQKIIEEKMNGFSAAYGLSYTDIYDFSSKKQSLKKFEIELGIHHQELGLPWDKDVPENMWEVVADYCVNDVEATEAVFEARKGDFVARQMLAEIAGMTPNDTTNSLTTRIIFGNEKHPKLVYTDLATGEQM